MHSVLLLTGVADIPEAMAAMRAGAVDCLRKPPTMATLSAALARAEEKLAKTRRSLTFKRLTDREREVLKAIGLGKSSKIIAYELGISIRTVEMHRGNVLAEAGRDQHRRGRHARPAIWPDRLACTVTAGDLHFAIAAICPAAPPAGDALPRPRMQARPPPRQKTGAVAGHHRHGAEARGKRAGRSDRDDGGHARRARAGQHHRRDRHQAPGHQPAIRREPERARHQPADPRRRHAELLQRSRAVGRHGGRRCRDGPQRHGQRRLARRRPRRSPARAPGHAVREERVGGPGLDRLEAPDRRTERRRTHLVRHLRRTACLGGRECPAHGPGGIPSGRLLQQPRRPGDERLRRREAQRPRRSRASRRGCSGGPRTTTGRSM